MPAGQSDALADGFPICRKCKNGLMLPLSDYGQDGSNVHWKAWACNNESCGFSLRIDKGEITFGNKTEQRKKF